MARLKLTVNSAANGEIVNGAWKTSRKRPWAFAVVIEGFPTKISALQFEWAWQNPNKHRGVKKDLPTNIHKKPGCGPKFQILGMLLKSTPWSQYTLSLHFLNIKMRDTFLDATSYMIGMGDFCRISPLENLHDKSLDEEEESASCKENGMDEQGESGKNLVFEEQKRVDFLDSCDICQNDLVGSIKTALFVKQSGMLNALQNCSYLIFLNSFFLVMEIAPHAQTQSNGETLLEV
eukprot:CAMPEP_0117853088 /NCGR_PEP_ID=MMETSP0949-20121206/23468_1 /TAXON_ID=44440 /ORGANISM="Chattonella subsalsa, Strain CCMP2191" /LENGTH=233 /DNA_ID=CAMNT_0005701393 /DNA_START=84 /DNA_END=787 /DNA_ORIENTATION=-